MESCNSDLRYHRMVFEMLDQQPTRSAEGEKVIRDWEQVHSRRFPAAVREWYSLRDSAAVLHISGRRRMMPLGDLLANIKPAYSSRGERVERWIDEDAEFGGVDLMFDGEDDPSVEYSESWCPFDRFSNYIKTTVWSDFFIPPRLVVETPLASGRFGPEQLEHLLASFHEFSRDGRRVFRNPKTGELFLGYTFRIELFKSGVRLIIVCPDGDATHSECAAKWTVSVDTAPLLESFLSGYTSRFGYMAFTNLDGHPVDGGDAVTVSVK